MIPSKYIYMVVSDDKYELPIAVADSVKELSDLTGINAGTIYTGAFRWERGETKKSRFIRIRKEAI